MNIENRVALPTASALMLMAGAAHSNYSTSENSVLGILAENPEHTLFVEAIETAGLADILAREKGITLFLPTDEALEKAAIDIDLGEPLSPDQREELVELLSYHIVDDEIASSAIAGDRVSYESIAGESIDIYSTGISTKVNDASLLIPDMKAENGVVHVIDSVLQPSKSDSLY